MNRPLTTLAALLLSVSPALAWNREGHEKITATAVESLPADVPDFFKQKIEAIARDSADPDVYRNDATPELRGAERPEHFFDYEPLQGQAPPPMRYQFIGLCHRLKLDPTDVGFLPYAIAENAQKLQIAFAEYRAKPNDPDAQAKCVVYAGIVAHYAGDLCQPLHVTVDYDGRLVDGKSPHSGIHSRVDDVLKRVDVKPRDLAREIHPKALDEWIKDTMAQIEKSHALVDRVYELDKQFPEYKAAGPVSDAVRAFAEERLRAGAEFTASVLLTAWERSAKTKLPEWYLEGK